VGAERPTAQDHAKAEGKVSMPLGRHRSHFPGLKGPGWTSWTLYRLCSVCGVKIDPREQGYRGPCDTCRRERNRARGTRQRRGYTDAWLQLVKLAIRQQPYCSVCGVTSDLTGDHRVPLAKGGTSTLENVQVLCRSCNSSKGSRVGRSDARFLSSASSNPRPLLGEKESQSPNAEIDLG